MAKYFVQFDGGNGSYFEADTDEQAKGFAGVALDGYQQAHNPKGTARLMRMVKPNKALVMGNFTPDFKFHAGTL